MVVLCGLIHKSAEYITIRIFEVCPSVLHSTGSPSHQKQIKELSPILIQKLLNVIKKQILQSVLITNSNEIFFVGYASNYSTHLLRLQVINEFQLQNKLMSFN